MVHAAAHGIDLLRIVRDEGKQLFLAPVSRIARQRTPSVLARIFGHEGEEVARARKGLCFGGDLIIDHAIASVDVRAAQFFLGSCVIAVLLKVGAHRIDNSRASGEDLAQPAHHERIMAGNRACCAQSRCRAEREGDNRNIVEIVDHLAPARNRGNIGRADLLQSFHTAAAACPVNHPDERQFQLARHLLCLHHLAADACVRRAASYGKIVSGGDDWSAIDRGFAEQEGGGEHAFEIAIFVIGAFARDFANLAERAFVAKCCKPSARIHLAAPMLPRDLGLAAHLFG